MFYALNQKDFLVAGYTNPKYFKECKALFICGTPLATDKGFEDKLTSNFAKSKEILKTEGYDGTPIVLLYATDTNTGRLTPILKGAAGARRLHRRHAGDGLEHRGRAPHAQGAATRRAAGDGFLTTWVSADLLDPVMSAFLGANCEKAAIGWPCDAKLEELRDAFARTTDPEKRKELATAVQVRMSEYPTHVQLGQFSVPRRSAAPSRAHLRRPRRCSGT